MTTASIIGSDLVPLKQRGLVQGILSVLYGIGAGLGGPLGGFLADHGGWRIAFLGMFLINGSLSAYTIYMRKALKINYDWRLFLTYLFCDWFLLFSFFFQFRSHWRYWV